MYPYYDVLLTLHSLDSNRLAGSSPAPEARMQRRMTVAGVVTAALTLVAGCASAVGEPPPSTNGIGPITFAIGSDDVNAWLDPVIDQWNTEHPDQHVTVLYLPEASNVQLDQLVANLQAKSPVYDVIDMDVVWTAEFAANGWIIQLKDQDFPLADFFGSAVATAQYQGKLYAVPDYTNADLLYYRKDILTKAQVPLPAPGSTWTWAQLADLASTVAPRYGLAGYAATLAQYEGLTVNFAEAVQSAGGSILNQSGTAATLTTQQALNGLNNLWRGIRQGWIPKQTLHYEELSAQQAFENGQYLFLNDWPDVYSVLNTPGPGNKVYGKFGVAALPGPDGPGSSTLGGANLAISAYSLHQETALRFIQYLTAYPQQKEMLEQGSFPPVLKTLYYDPGLTARFQYLPTLYRAIETAQPRPAITNYDQASLAISSEVYQALNGNKTPEAALSAMQGDLTQIIRDG
jgi:trehalose/maltose transport system substrate-binding protein